MQPIMLLLMFPLCVMANWQAVETFHHGSIFAEFRAKLELQSGFVVDLLQCPYCLSHWTAWVISIATLPRNGDVFTLQEVTILLVYGLAVARGSNFMNDYFHEICRTPRVEKTLDPDTEAALSELANPRPTDSNQSQ